MTTIRPLEEALTRPEVVDLLKLWGVPYDYGQGSPATTWPPTRLDCSGLVQVCLVRLGMLNPKATDRNSQTLAADSVQVLEGAERLGDLAFYGPHGRVEHVMFVLAPGVVYGAHGAGIGTHSDNPRAFVRPERLRYRSDLLKIGRLPQGG